MAVILLLIVGVLKSSTVKARKWIPARSSQSSPNSLPKGNTDDGELIEVRRMYRQNGNLIKNEAVKVKGLDKPADSLTDQFCQANKAATGDHDSFKDRGGMKAMGEAMKERHGSCAEYMGRRNGQDAVA
ncbi:hypothetical protein PGT21_008683 [Puccinia graminis f. sp. tritici]|uniref:cellulose 1,4-beta-cellobiosidase (non-reducing end) n=1 Tax=Puccinia graminis f. sp. tritici TaxID=56615 RepID=A0A5B0QEU6_PUCGR|nr:hypothetical protein PGT21_008683 [Puccinia graminis f. sp. tritici]